MLPNCFIMNEGCRESKKVEKHCSRHFSAFLQTNLNEMNVTQKILRSKFTFESVPFICNECANFILAISKNENNIRLVKSHFVDFFGISLPFIKTN